jgi:hypothetical protein
MKFINLLFSSNKRKWITFLEKVERPIDRYGISKWRFIVDNFFIKHNIDFEKYSTHALWDMNILSIDRDENLSNYCSWSFKNNFANSYSRKLTNLSLGENNWFYYAYPDVATWFEDKYDEIEIHCNSKGYFYSIDDPKYNLHVFEFVIEQYLMNFPTLECTMK